MSKYINTLKSPEDLKCFSERELELLAYEIRDFLLSKISLTGGHLASNLGVVELTIALHKVFESPKDKIIWDVGHQSYIHKILTGRAHQFDTLRQFQGLSGFPKKNESEHDIYESGHSSNSISIALGIAKARDLRQEDFSVVSVIGDGALTGGVAYEALNNAGHVNTNMIVILNDNEMSISQNIGGISKHLSRLRTAPAYKDLKERLKKTLNKIPKAGGTVYSALEKIRDAVKYTIVAGIVFEELGFTYLGPVDGHNIKELIAVFENAKDAKGPVLIHILTKKGKGYRNAEKEPHIFHGISAFDIETGELKDKSSVPTYSKVFGKKLVDIAENNIKVVSVTAAMADGTGLVDFSKKFPERFFDVGIAEQHAVSFAAGLAMNGMVPVVAIYSTFLQRAYDQIMTDVCLQKLPVVFCVDRSGVVGEDGETHHGLFDISYLNHLPNMTILAPKDRSELDAMLEYAINLGKPCAIRYPRGRAEDLNHSSIEDLAKGKAEILLSGEELCIAAVGRMIKPAYEAACFLRENNIRITVINARFIKPLDEKTFLNMFNKFDKIITIEDNTKIGGFGSSIASLMQKHHMENELHIMGWPDKYIEHGTVKELDEKYELDSKGIIKHVLSILNRRI